MQGLGPVYGTGMKGPFNGNEQMMAAAQDEMRSRTAALGGNFVVMDLSTRDEHGLSLSGRALSCKERPQGPDTLAVPANPPETARAAVEPSAEQRLQTLEDLHKKGLVNDDEYQQRRKAIVDSL